jgi:flavin-dependent dehydrogenase
VRIDVAVVGGGPAGCIVARRLARAGADVHLYAAGGVHGCEGLSRRTHELLLEEGLQPASQGLRGPVPRGGSWGEGRAVTGFEWLVDRADLAAHLREAAVADRVRLHDDSVLQIEPRSGGLRLRTRSGADVHARFVVDARGRRGPEERGPRMLAVGQRFARSEPLEPGTSVHALPWGWCWLVQEGRRVWVQLVSRTRQRHPEAWLAVASAELPALRHALEGAEPTSALVARPAHARRAARPGAEYLFRVGDAAVGLDPLSGQGVYEALRGARVVAAAVGSALAGESVALVQRFVADRYATVWERCLATAADFYAENIPLGAFWADTARDYRALVPAARTGAPAIERRPVLDGDRILERDVVVTAAQPRGVWLVDEVPLVELLHYIQQAGNATLAEAASALDRPRPAIAAAVRWLHSAGALPSRAVEGISAGG